MKSLRLLMVTEPGIDGVFAMVDTIIRHMHREHPQISVDLAYSSRRSGSALRDLVRAIEERGDRTIDLQVGSSPEPSDLRAMWRLVDFARKRERNLVHAHSSKAGALARIVRLVAPFPKVVYSPHAYYGMPRLGGRKEAIFNSVEAVLGRIGTSICCSEDERDFATGVLHIPGDRLQIIHNGIDIRHFAPADAAKKAAGRRLLGLPETGRILATIGRDSIQKNYGPLYGALDEILPGAGWSFAHTGAGSTGLKNSLSIAAAARCHNFEHLDDVAPLLQAADGFVMTSRYEGLSLAMLSALSCGLPTLLTDAPGFRFLNQSGFADIIWLPKPEDPWALKESLGRTLKSWASKPPEILSRQRDLVCGLFSDTIQIEKFCAFYGRH